MIARLRELVRRIRRPLQRLDHWIGLKLFPRATDAAVTRTDGFVIRHVVNDRPIEIYHGLGFGDAIAHWASLTSPARRPEHPGELQLWKNGKTRATSPAVMS